MSQQQVLHNFLSPMIETNSVSSDNLVQDASNLVVCEYIANELDELGFNTKLYPVPESNNKWNLVAHLPGHTHDSGGIMLSGHTDTVPAISAQWDTDPWQIHRQDDQLTGLGVTDMKGFFASLILALRELSKSSLHSLSKPLTVIATADEETSMAGARALKSEWLNSPSLNIIGEPTSLSPRISHKGYLAYRVELSSKGGHSSVNAQQRNCIEAAHSIAQKLIELRSKLQDLSSDDAFSVPVSTLNLGTLSAGDAINRICANATLEFDIRPLPGIDCNELEEWVTDAIRQGAKGFDVTFETSTIYPPVSGFQSSLSQTLQSQLKHVCGCHLGSANYVTEAPWFEKLGIPTVVLGPGDINQAHQANESILISELLNAEQLYQDLILKNCLD